MTKYFQDNLKGGKPPPLPNLLIFLSSLPVIFHIFLHFPLSTYVLPNCCIKFQELDNRGVYTKHQHQQLLHSQLWPGYFEVKGYLFSFLYRTILNLAITMFESSITPRVSMGNKTIRNCMCIRNSAYRFSGIKIITYIVCVCVLQVRGAMAIGFCQGI